jgi:putative transposase
MARAFKSYFDGRARFPKRKKTQKYRSLTYPQSGFKLDGEVVQKGKGAELRGKLYLSKIGYVRFFMHRQLKGNVKNLIVKYEAGMWYAVFVCEISYKPKKPIEQIPDERIRGGDLGLLKFLTLSDGSSPEYPKYLRRSEVKIKRLQKVLSRAKKGSQNFRKLALRIARLHHHVARQRENRQNQILANLYKENDAIILEKLHVENLMKNHNLAKNLQDVAFGKFIRKTKFKAELLGKWFIPVDPWGTTQFCWKCLTWVPKSLDEREHMCPNCGEELGRDENSAKLIKKLGLSRLGLEPCYAPGRGVKKPAEPEPLPSLRGLASRGVEAGNPHLSEGVRHIVDVKK